ncbi:MAG TPA: glycerophosphodiester phosphodiesterase family protein [Anaerolineaceae bacterium]|nr:glycerophosphodiester phosphodiesterase family protein [Anaerolineaceae bacterium]
MNLLTDLPRPVFFAHRGACAHAPENTLASFRLAVEHGAPAVELDAKLSADGQVVVIHDPTINRTTDGKGFVNHLPLAALRELDAGSFFAPRFRGERIPTLEEVFETVGRNILVNVELTNYTSPLDALTIKVAELIKRLNNADQVIFSSFQPLNLVRIRQMLPQVPVAILFSQGAARRKTTAWLGRRVAPEIVHPYLTDATADFIQHQHTLKRRVHVWTVNDPQEMRRLFAADVDGIFTDDPLLARQTLENMA